MRTNPSGGTGSTATTVVAQAGQYVGNHVYAGLGDSGAFDLFSTRANHVLVDVVGYFTPLPRTGFVDDPRGNRVEYRYDERGRLVSRTDQAGHATAWAYDDAGFVASTANEAGVQTSYTYDDDGHVLTQRLSQYVDSIFGTRRELWGSTTYFGYVDDPARPAVDGKVAWVADGRSASPEDAHLPDHLQLRRPRPADVGAGPVAGRGGAGGGGDPRLRGRRRATRPVSRRAGGGPAGPVGVRDQRRGADHRVVLRRGRGPA